MRARSCTYSGNRVWNDVVKGQPSLLHRRRAAIPSGPSVAMWTASGSNASASWRSFRDGNSASEISG